MTSYLKENILRDVILLILFLMVAYFIDLRTAIYCLLLGLVAGLIYRVVFQIFNKYDSG